MRNKTIIIMIGIVLIVIGCSKKKDIEIKVVYSKNITNGIIYKELDLLGPVKSNAYILEINSDDKNVRIGMTTAGKKMEGHLATVKAIVQENNGIAGINASYYGHGYNAFSPGAIRSLLIINKELVSSPNDIDSRLKVGIGITQNNKLVIVPDIEYRSKVILANRNELINILVNVFNWKEEAKYILFTPKFGYYTPKSNGIKIILKPLNEGILPINKNIKTKVVAIKTDEIISIPKDCFVLLVKDALVKEKDFKDNDIICLYFSVSNKLLNIENAIGSPWYIVENDKINISPFKEENNKAEQTTFIGKSKNKLILGCLNISREDLPIFLKKLNIENAGFLDGGGSSSLVVENENKYGGKRAVADALVIYNNKK